MSKKPVSKKRGRKPLPKAELKSVPFGLKISGLDERIVYWASSLAQDKPYNWARRMVVLAARNAIIAAGFDPEKAPPVKKTRSRV